MSTNNLATSSAVKGSDKVMKEAYFTEQDATKLYSEAFTVSGCEWRILVFPKGNAPDHLSLYLDVPDSATLPNGWTRKAKFSLSVIDQANNGRSVRKETQHDFNASDSDWGYTSFIPLTELHDRTGGYLANDTLLIKAEVYILTVTPPVNIQPARTTDKFDSYFIGLEELVNAAETNGVGVGSSSCHQDGALAAEIPTLEEVEKAKQSLKECLSDLFKLNMKERLSEALSTLSSARTGLSPEQQIAIETFRANFSDFTSDFLTFEQDNAEFELHKLQKDRRFFTMKKGHETHVLYKQLMDDLAKEEEELKRKMEEVKEELKRKMEGVKSRRNKLLSDWEILLVDSEEAKLGYKDELKKLAEAEETKRIAEERMSRSTTAWSNLKAQFC
ncbi:MATH domain and coiled-coil domain-containing protein At2g01790 [Eucalyptus grandis]|uniref:MATH domain and coiled-coil domain-containing protein At2g01790 n=1 Tax=Eucalyptus grandis TaxID=71139 RepID=UPI00192E9A8B|nr:MATH domain and coiled-coil domain-containing protein At2g01790 [Eucalyptus grandis]